MMIFLRKSTKVIVLLFSCIFVANLADADVLTLEQAVKLAKDNSPLLKAVHEQVEADKNSLSTSGLWENPELEFEADDIGGDKDGLENATYITALKQTIPLGGKSKHKRALARQRTEISKNILNQSVLDLRENVTQTFIELVALQEIAKIRAEQEQLSSQFVVLAKERLRAGAGSELEVIQAELGLSELKLNKSSSLANLNDAKAKLASMLNLSLDRISELKMPYYELHSVDDLKISDSFPALRILDAVIKKNTSQALLSKAEDIPDITIGAGIKHERESKINSCLISASIPLPFNGLGKKQYSADMLKISAAQAKREDEYRKLQRELESLKILYNTKKSQVDLINKQLIPNAKKAYELSRKGYETGRYSWMELIVAQKNHAEINLSYIEYLREAHLIYNKLLKFD